MAKKISSKKTVKKADSKKHKVKRDKRSPQTGRSMEIPPEKPKNGKPKKNK